MIDREKLSIIELPEQPDMITRACVMEHLIELAKECGVTRDKELYYNLLDRFFPEKPNAEERKESFGKAIDGISRIFSKVFEDMVSKNNDDSDKNETPTQS